MKKEIIVKCWITSNGKKCVALCLVINDKDYVITWDRQLISMALELPVYGLDDLSIGKHSIILI